MRHTMRTLAILLCLLAAPSAQAAATGKLHNCWKIDEQQTGVPLYIGNYQMPEKNFTWSKIYSETCPQFETYKVPEITPDNYFTYLV